MTKEAEFLQFRILEGNAENFHATEKYIRRSFQTTYWMNVALFLIGVGAFLGAIIKGFVADSAAEAATSGVFAGLSVASFIASFIFRPLESIEQDSIYITWLLSVFNTYLYRLVYFNNQETFDGDIRRAEQDLVERLKELAETHSAKAWTRRGARSRSRGRTSRRDSGRSEPEPSDPPAPGT